MHIPDGFLSTPVWATLDALSVPAVVWAARRADTRDNNIPLMGVMGAFVFAAQMINFPVGLGTSGHLLGGALLGMVLGPAAAVVVMTAIVALQAFVFQDGGVLVMGANVLNMAVAGVAVGYLPLWLFGARFRSTAIFCGGLLSVLVSACLALEELLLSGVKMPGQALAISLALFTLSAIVEGVVTLAAVRAIERLRPDSLRTPQSGRSLISALAGVSVVLAVFGTLVATALPDGVARLAEFAGLQSTPTWITSPLAGYKVAGFSQEWISQVFAGLAGVALIYGLCVGAGRLLARKNA